VAGSRIACGQPGKHFPQLQVRRATTRPRPTALSLSRAFPEVPRVAPNGPLHADSTPTPEAAVRIDIVIPAHNEEHRIARTLTAYRRELPDPDVRFVVAMDACTDRTADVVAEQTADDARVEGVHFPKLGKGGVIREAFGRSDADLVGFVDADGATPPAEFMRLVDAAGDADGAIASRRHAAAVLPVTRPWRRRVASRGFAFGVRVLTGLPYADTQCGAKVLHRDAARASLRHVRTTDLSFDVDLLLAADDLGLRVVEVPTVWIDRDGSRVDALRDTRRMGGSLLRLWARRRLRAATPWRTGIAAEAARA
jgi:glycosyltransferase involved in cell wall biosynthesis